MGHQALSSELVVFIAAEVGLAERLLAAHVADDHGRCRGCPNGAAVHMPWPCPLHSAAVDAIRHRRRGCHEPHAGGLSASAPPGSEFQKLHVRPGTTQKVSA